MFDDIDYLALGNEKQILAYKAIKNLGIMESLAEYNPVLCGTIPIGIDIAGSDLDLIMEVSDFERFMEKVEMLYGNKENFKIKRLLIREVPVVKVNFIFEGFEFELFGQPQPVKEQYAYLHMMIVNAVMKRFPNMRNDVIYLKKQGYKTEPAFCKVLGLKGDSYESLLAYGRYMGII
ncbi:DUF4269 domain-containing protein [Bacillus testis]|uniref:DUF4269 domain-containing protein n=1 Tax=Bacillus testis TaxID=1622072 RepID=UPI00067F44E2|nr:DUF4269 domain-containing protein [Bacillus testis]